MADKTTRIILALLAAGIWLNAAALLLRPTPVMAQQPNAAASWSAMAQALTAIADGSCVNRRLCGSP